MASAIQHIPLDSGPPSSGSEQDLATPTLVSGAESEASSEHKWKGKEREADDTQEDGCIDDEKVETAGTEYPPATTENAETRRIKEVGRLLSNKHTSNKSPVSDLTTLGDSRARTTEGCASVRCCPAQINRRRRDGLPLA